MSRHGAPVRNRHAIPSNVPRISQIARPTPFNIGNNGASTAHDSSEISCLTVMGPDSPKPTPIPFTNTPSGVRGVVQVVVGPQRRDERRLVDEVGASGVDEDERGAGSRQPGTVDDDEAAGGMQADDGDRVAVAVGGLVGAHRDAALGLEVVERALDYVAALVAVALVVVTDDG